MIKAQNIDLKLGGKSILSDVSVAVEAGECVGLIGRNGAGKTSLLRAMMAMNDDAKGQCNLWDLDAKKRSQIAGWLAQERSVSWDLNVAEIIALGRIPWQGFGGRAHNEDAQHVAGAIERMSLPAFLKRQFQTLSGGERARVLIARLLAQNTPVIMADEPIAALDPAYQLQAMQLFQELAQEGRAVVISIHDLGLAARFCTRLVLLDQGRVVANGAPQEVLSDEKLEAYFNIRAFKHVTDEGIIIQPIEAMERKNE